MSDKTMRELLDSSSKELITEDTKYLGIGNAKNKAQKNLVAVDKAFQKCWDAFEALTTHEEYKGKLPQQKAVDALNDIESAIDQLSGALK